MELYISTTVLVLCAISFIIGIAKLSHMKVFMHKRDLVYIKRFEALEQIIKGDIKTILEILKNEKHKVD